MRWIVQVNSEVGESSPSRESTVLPDGRLTLTFNEGVLACSGIDPD
jgi:hypothetical protein